RRGVFLPWILRSRARRAKGHRPLSDRSIRHIRWYGSSFCDTSCHRPVDLKQLEYFVRVAELGSFTRASQALDVAQPALSRQVRLLEVELRQTLLVCFFNGTAPTEAGKL